ncbi:N-terminal acetyltransferase A complex auxiliary subunit NAA15-like isoform X2 [Humulus lupulus]|uniref:N-terminal acetyltransferase A complex auxiliary subunit NAA15-like isoform X2 n=1 Tax=Humulus lupulus TaxID=3486 RepID=UPI002B404B8A|nr:N-terminal acetyltransferase A complex auxiliary subunit NAA15-like isoform X2 [Humulus lupulus]
MARVRWLTTMMCGGFHGSRRRLTDGASSVVSALPTVLENPSPPKSSFNEKSYETKQYKKGLKAADTILKKFPDHGETLSMKGLTLNCMDRKSEAYELVRQGLKNDLKSHVCWHVYGLLYRSGREYREAIKCYRNALRINPDNIEILQDLSLLQVQMRDLAGFFETRQQLLSLKSNHRMNWIGFVVAHHLNSNALKAVEILKAYEGTLEDDFPPDNERCEHGEMLLYKISLLEEPGSIERALDELHKKEPKIVDKLAFKEQEVSLLVKLGCFEEGATLFKALLSMNPDNYGYYEGLHKCVELYYENGQYSPDQIEQLELLYNSLRQQYTWYSAVKRIPLDFLQGVRFREAAENYIRPFLTKGVPSLFTDLSPLYDHPGKADILKELIIELEHAVRNSGQFPRRYIEMISLEQFLTTFVVEAFRMEECISLIFIYISCFVFSDKGI